MYLVFRCVALNGMMSTLNWTFLWYLNSDSQSNAYFLVCSLSVLFSRFREMTRKPDTTIPKTRLNIEEQHTSSLLLTCFAHDTDRTFHLSLHSPLQPFGDSLIEISPIALSRIPSGHLKELTTHFIQVYTRQQYYTICINNDNNDQDSKFPSPVYLWLLIRSDLSLVCNTPVTRVELGCCCKVFDYLWNIPV